MLLRLDRKSGHRVGSVLRTPALQELRELLRRKGRAVSRSQLFGTVRLIPHRGLDDPDLDHAHRACHDLGSGLHGAGRMQRHATPCNAMQRHGNEVAGIAFWRIYQGGIFSTLIL